MCDKNYTTQIRANQEKWYKKYACKCLKQMKTVLAQKIVVHTEIGDLYVTLLTPLTQKCTNNSAKSSKNVNKKH